MWTIDTVELGQRTAESSMFLHLTDIGVPLQIAYRAWVLRRGDEVVLVDTGPPLREAAQRGLRNVVPLDEGLARLGIDAQSVSAVLLTHLHWDHAANALCLPRAVFHAQQRELAFYRSRKRRHPAFNRFFSADTDLRGLIEQGRIVGLPPRQTFREGIEVFRVGGHTPGSQMVQVQTSYGKALICGDAIPLYRNFSECIPSGILSDLAECIAALTVVRRNGIDMLYPGHDMVPAWPVRTPAPPLNA